MIYEYNYKYILSKWKGVNCLNYKIFKHEISNFSYENVTISFQYCAF